MTRKDQNKILDNKIESNINQYKVDRLNAEISAFSSRNISFFTFMFLITSGIHDFTIPNFIISICHIDH